MENLYFDHGWMECQMLKIFIALAIVDLLVFAFPFRSDKSPLTVSPFSYNLIFLSSFSSSKSEFFSSSSLSLSSCYIIRLFVTLPNIEIYKINFIRIKYMMKWLGKYFKGQERKNVSEENISNKKSIMLIKWNRLFVRRRRRNWIAPHEKKMKYCLCFGLNIDCIDQESTTNK